MQSFIHSHPFFHPSAEDSRAPCPALNMLANHGYLPRSGRDIKLTELVKSLVEVFNLSIPLAFMLSFIAILLCGDILRMRLNLDDLRRHNVIEHDQSLVHADCAPGEKLAPSLVDEGKLNLLLRTASRRCGVTVSEFARLRAQIQLGAKTRLDTIHTSVAFGEAALAWLVFQREDGVIPEERLSKVLREERFPEDWVPPTQPIGLIMTHRVATFVQTLTAIILSRTDDRAPSLQFATLHRSDSVTSLHSPH